MEIQQAAISKPSRSDEILDEDQQLEITNQVRAKFESLAPKRPVKPNRSESDSTATIPPTSYAPDQNYYAAPELDKLRSLQSRSQTIFVGAGTMELEEFIETQYYKELDSVDKLHHTTGTGFIKVASETSGNDYDRRQEGHGNGNGGIKPMGLKSNPATNDWIPSTEDDHHQVPLVSSKPNRSDST